MIIIFTCGLLNYSTSFLQYDCRKEYADKIKNPLFSFVCWKYNEMDTEYREIVRKLENNFYDICVLAAV